MKMDAFQSVRMYICPSETGINQDGSAEFQEPGEYV